MKLFIPYIGASIVLLKDWNFTLYGEYRNSKMYEFFTGKSYDSHGQMLPVTLPMDTVLTVDRVYIRKGNQDYNSISFLVKKFPFEKKGKLRFWAKLGDVNTIECDIYQ